MKVLTLFGTRPEIIRLSLIIKSLDGYVDQMLVHTGQNYDPNLSDIFLEQLRVRKLDFHLGIKSSSFGDQAGQILAKTDELLEQVKPDRVLVLGDTNSGLAAIVAARRGVPVYHLEAGNRCFDNRVPEEINRRIIDHSSDILMPYTHRSAENLVAEGIRRERIFVVGNPIREVLEHYAPEIQESDVLSRCGLSVKSYFVATLHRAENVDHLQRLNSLLLGMDRLAEAFACPVLVSVHPRTADRIKRAGIKVDSKRIRMEKPLGFFDFIHLEKNAMGVITDSGTVQEEACIFEIPNVTIRDVTERPETTECGSNFLAGSESDFLVTGMSLALKQDGTWRAPEEYLRTNVSNTVAKIILSYR